MEPIDDYEYVDPGYDNEVGDKFEPIVDEVKTYSPVVVTSDSARELTKKNEAELSRLMQLKGMRNY